MVSGKEVLVGLRQARNPRILSTAFGGLSILLKETQSWSFKDFLADSAVRLHMCNFSSHTAFEMSRLLFHRPTSLTLWMRMILVDLCGPRLHRVELENEFSIGGMNDGRAGQCPSPSFAVGMRIELHTHPVRSGCFHSCSSAIVNFLCCSCTAYSPLSSLFIYMYDYIVQELA